MDSQVKNKEFLVTARKWRPLKFTDVVGQQHITVTLQNAVRSQRIHHAYLFSGPRGVGKTTTARILARIINCTNPKDFEPCNECESCKAIIEGRSLDVIEIDGASNNSVDDIRKLRENSRYLPANGYYKMYIIDEVHMLSTSAFNALLKTLEEPPPHLLFVFATTEPHKVLPTILSRCQRFEFKRMEIDDIVRQLRVISEKEKIVIDDTCLITIAKKGDGSMRDSQSIFDQVRAFCGTEIDYSKMADALHLVDQEFFFRITNDIKEKNIEDVFVLTKEILSKGYDLQECIEGLQEHLRNILAVKVTSRADLVETSKDMLIRYKEEAEKFTKPDLLRLLQIASATDQSLRYAPQPRIKFELALVQMATLDSTVEIMEILNALSELKKNSNLAGQSGAAPVYQSKSHQEMNNPNVPDSKYEPQLTAISALSNLSKSTSKESLSVRWNGFIEKYANSETGLYPLKQTDNIICKFFEGEIVFYCKMALLNSILNAKKRELTDYLQEYYGAEIKFKILTIGNEENILEDVVAKDEFDIDEEENVSHSADLSPADIIHQNKEKEIESSIRKSEAEALNNKATDLEEKIMKLFSAVVIS